MKVFLSVLVAALILIAHQASAAPIRLPKLGGLFESKMARPVGKTERAPVKTPSESKASSAFQEAPPLRAMSPRTTPPTGLAQQFASQAARAKTFRPKYSRVQISFTAINVSANVVSVRPSHLINIEITLVDLSLVGISVPTAIGLISSQNTAKDEEFAADLAAAALNGETHYVAKLCAVGIVAQYAIPSADQQCLDGSAPLRTGAPIDLSMLKVVKDTRAAKPSPQVPTFAEIESSLVDQSEAGLMFAKWRLLFPAEFKQLVSSLQSVKRTGGGDAEWSATILDSLRNVLESNRAYITQAEPGVLAAIGTQHSKTARALNVGDRAACREFFLSDDLVYFPRSAVSDSAFDSLLTLSRLSLDGIASGKTSPHSYPPVLFDDQDELIKATSPRVTQIVGWEANSQLEEKDKDATFLCEYAVVTFDVLETFPIQDRPKYWATFLSK